MADPGIGVLSRAILFTVLFLNVFSNPVNIPLQSVSDLLIQSALNSLNEDSPTRHTYKGGNLISAQKLLEPPYVIYRLTLNLEPECDGDSSSCPREACAINLKQHELGVIEVQKSSIQCMYLYPQVQDEEVNRVQQTQQENSLDTNLQDQDVIESLDKQILNQSVELDHEVQTAADQNDEPFIAVRASNLKYCPGCPYELNPTLPGLSAFAEQAVQSMDEAGQTEYKHKLVSIVRVTRAVPPGSNVVQYNLLLDIGESNCLNSTPIDRSECSLQSNIPIRLCQVTFEERPWQENSRQITKNNCTEGQGVENELSSSRSPNIAAHSLVSSRLNNQQSVQEVLVKTSNYDQLTQERKTATYGSLIDELFGNPVNATVVEIATEQTGTPVTEETLTKIVLNNDNEKEEAVFFNDKFKEFDEFLEDFNVSIKTEVSIPSSTGVPVTEEVIVAVKVNEENIPTEASSKDNKETQVTNLITYELNNSSSESNSSEEVQTSGIVQVKDSSEESQESAESKELPVALKRKKRALSSKLPQSEINFINALAKKAVDILDDIDIDNGKRIIVAVENATTIYSHGIIYRITMLIANTSCDENSRHELNCKNKIIPPTKRCKVEVHLDGKRLLHTAKVAKSSCCDLPEEVNNHETRRRRGISGGVNAISVSDPEVVKYASMGLETFSTNFEGPNEPILVEIQEASVQVVSGNLYKIKVKLGTSNCPKGTKNNCALKPDSETKVCLIKVWSQPWLDEGSPDVKVNCDQTRRKRGISGGVNSISVNDPEVVKYASMGLETFSTNFEGPNEPILVEIQEASLQVVSGNLYKIKVKLGTSNCPKGTKNNCALKPDSETKVCLIKVWSQPWLDEGSPDVKVNCDQTRRKRGISGGVNSISVNDPEVVKYASMGLETFSTNFEGPNEPILVEIQEASLQVVSGNLYKIKVKLGTSNCPKGTKNNCALKPDSETKVCLIKVWSQPWLDEGSPDVKVNCDQTRRKRGISGGVNSISVNDPEVVKYASMGLETFSTNFEGPNEPILVEIQEASLQVVSGNLYKIKVKLGTSNCPKGTKNNCALKPDSETKVCLIKVWSQPWLDEGSPDVKVNCDQTRRKRGISGGVNSISVNDPEVVKYASMGLETFSTNFEGPNEPILVEIQEASLQVVSGNLYKIKVKLGTSNCPKGTKNNCALKPDSETKVCLIKVWSQPWLDEGSPDVKVNCDQTRRKRGISGGVNSISVNDPEVVKYASMGLETFSTNFEGPNEPILVEIQEASLQVVSGNLYKIKVKLGTSNCPKGTKNNCALKPDSETKVCLIKVWSQPWLDEGSPDVKVNCDQTRRKRGIPGGVNAISVSDPEVLKYANMGLQKFSANSEGPNEPILVEIQEASVQVVSGYLYKIKVKLGTSNCPKGTKNNCALKPDSETKVCLIKVWSQPWLDKGSPDVKVTCDQTRKKRGIPGGVNAISVSDPEVLKYASMGLETFSTNFEGPNEPILVEIQEASVQVVSGSLYKIKVKLGTSNCPKGTKNNCALKPDSETKVCLIKVWSRPWLDKGSPDVKVNCDQTPRRKRSLRGVNYSLKMMNQAKHFKYEKMFEQFTQDFNKTYSSSKERKDRFKIFKKNLNVIEELQKNEQGTAKYGITMFADLSTREFKKKYLGLRPDLKLENHIPMPMAEIPDNVELPTEFDWRDRHVVTEVKDQGQCGSCWAFSVTGNIESLYAIKYKNLWSLSEQELVDCDTYDQGCGGGLPENAYRAIENLGGLELEKDYPYEAENEKCHFNKSKAKVIITSSVNITSNETLMAKWLVSNGPISIGINANAMQFYMGGVSHPYKFLCSPDNLDHGVLIVGYGIHTYPLFNKKLPYWTIKNSWGPRWGEQGYYRVYRGDGTCGVNQMASSAIVA